MWNIVARPEGRYVEPDDDEDGERANQSHMKVMLVGGGTRTEVIARVGFARRHTKHPDVEFPVQLRVEIEKARKARDVMAELLGDPETLR